MEKLKELFQLDQPDLDFGFYRIMHMKAEEISQFLDQDLLQIIEDEFKDSSKEKSKSEAELAREALISALGEDALNEDGTVKEALSAVPAAKAYTEAMEIAGAHVASLSDEGQIYDHLYRFFERYYEGGDFLSRRYYTRETAGQAAPYAIPYNGEEVKLHWANSDQYYIKTAEHFSNYSFDLIKGSEVNAEDKRKKGITEEADLFSAYGALAEKLAVHFQIAEAAEGEHGNIKASDDEKRFFFLHKSVPIAFNTKDELMINFEYRPAASEDALDTDRKAELKNYHLKKDGIPYGGSVAEGELPPLNIADRVLEALNASASAHAATYLGLLQQTAPTDKINSRPLLAKYIKQYTARNSMDYFIHKDLGSFLRRELDFYIKNEIMRLDDLTSDSVQAPAVEDYLAKIKVLRKIAQKLITFLAQLEEFQKKLWLKKKFVTETNYCITLDRIPEEFYTEIVEAAEVQVLCLDGEMRNQREEWVKLFVIDEIKGEELGEVAYGTLLSVDFLKANDKLILDTKFFDKDFVERLLSSVVDFDGNCNGLLINSENFQAIKILESRYSNQVQCIYTDPPYNTNASEIIYKNSYKHSSWLSFLNDRARIAKNLLHDSGIFEIAIDDAEQHRLKCALDDVFGSDNHIANIAILHNPKGREQAFVSDAHEYTFLYAKKITSATMNRLPLSSDELKKKYPKNDSFDYYRELPLRRRGTAPFREDRPYMYFPFILQEAGEIDVIPRDEYSKIYDGAKFDDSYVDKLNSKYDSLGAKLIWPIRDDGALGRWRWGFDRCIESCKKKIFFVRGQNNSKTIYHKDYTNSTMLPKSLWFNNRYDASTKGTNVLKKILPGNSFDYPKSIFAVEDFLRLGMNDNDYCLDYFAGSGTTAHATINLNREGSGYRKFILIEMGEHFDSVVLPRINKVSYSPTWNDGRPLTRKEGVSLFYKYIRLESYEDCLNNLAFNNAEINPEGEFKESYYLNYLLDHQSKGSPSLLNIEQFSDPTAYKMQVKKPGSDASVEQAVDLIETFNYLIGLRVETLSAPQSFSANFVRPGDTDVPEGQQTKLQLDGRLKQDADGPFWFRAITGWVPKNASIPDKETREEKPQNKERVLIIWRKLTGDLEQDNVVLDEFFQRSGLSSLDSEFDTIYVNGSNNLPNLKLETDRWRVVLLEEAFHKLMWDTQDV